MSGSRASPRSRWSASATAGQTYALANALTRATGDYVSWLNCDDLTAPGALAHLRARVESERPDVVLGDFQVIDSDDQVLRTLQPSALDYDRLLRRGCYLFSGATYFRRPILEVVGFNPELHYCMDFDLFLRLTSRDDLTSLHIPEILAAFRYHKDSKSGSVARKFIVEAYRIRRAAVSNGPSGPTSLRWRLGRTVRPAVRQSLGTVLTSVRYTHTFARLRGGTHTT